MLREKRLLFLNAIVFPEIYEKVSRKHQKRNEQFMKSHRMLKTDFPVGAQVMIRDEMRKSKDTPRYEGPFAVVRREGSGNYRLKGIDGTEYSRPPQVLKMVGPQIMKDLQMADTIFAAVDKILEHKEEGGVVYYRTRWKNQGPSQDSWLRQEDFVDYGPLQRYEKVLGKGTLPGEEKENQRGEENLKVARAGQKKMVEFNQIKLAGIDPLSQHREELQEENTEVVLDLDKGQLDAVGEYWRQMKSIRKRKATIVESSDSEE